MTEDRCAPDGGSPFFGALYRHDGEGPGVTALEVYRFANEAELAEFVVQAGDDESRYALDPERAVRTMLGEVDAYRDLSEWPHMHAPSAWPCDPD